MNVHCIHIHRSIKLSNDFFVVKEVKSNHLWIAGSAWTLCKYGYAYRSCNR